VERQITSENDHERHAGGKSICRHCGQSIEAQPLFGQIRPSRGQVRPCAEQQPRGEDVADVGYPAQDSGRFGRRERNHGEEKVGLVIVD
jgi:hypothetical protein